MAKSLKQRMDILEAAIVLPNREIEVAYEDLDNPDMFRINNGRRLFTLEQVRAKIPEETILLIVRYKKGKFNEVKNDVQQT